MNLRKAYRKLHQIKKFNKKAWAYYLEHGKVGQALSGKRLNTKVLVKASKKRVKHA
jgi:hypothetical protein